MVLAIIGCVVVAWLALSLLVALLFGRAVKMGEVKHRDAVFLGTLADQKPGRLVSTR